MNDFFTSLGENLNTVYNTMDTIDERRYIKQMREQQLKSMNVKAQGDQVNLEQQQLELQQLKESVKMQNSSLTRQAMFDMVEALDSGSAESVNFILKSNPYAKQAVSMLSPIDIARIDSYDLTDELKYIDKDKVGEETYTMAQNQLQDMSSKDKFFKVTSVDGSQSIISTEQLKDMTNYNVWKGKQNLKLAAEIGSESGIVESLKDISPKLYEVAKKDKAIADALQQYKLSLESQKVRNQSASLSMQQERMYNPQTSIATDVQTELAAVPGGTEILRKIKTGRELTAEEYEVVNQAKNTANSQIMEKNLIATGTATPDQARTFNLYAKNPRAVLNDPRPIEETVGEKLSPTLTSIGVSEFMQQNKERVTSIIDKNLIAELDKYLVDNKGNKLSDDNINFVKAAWNDTIYNYLGKDLPGKDTEEFKQLSSTFQARLLSSAGNRAVSDKDMQIIKGIASVYQSTDALIDAFEGIRRSSADEITQTIETTVSNPTVKNELYDKFRGVTKFSRQQMGSSNNQSINLTPRENPYGKSDDDFDLVIVE